MLIFLHRCCLFFLILLQTYGRRRLPWTTVEERLKPLEGSCFAFESNWWNYEWCHRGSVWQFHDEERIEIGSYSATASQAETKRRQRLVHVYSDGERCSHRYAGTGVNTSSQTNHKRRFQSKRRSMIISFVCCRPEHPGDGDSIFRRRHRANIWIQNISEPMPCEYEAVVCTRAAACTFDRPEQIQERKRLSQMSNATRFEYREAARRMFFRGYDAYMHVAFPLGELRPVSCKGDLFGLVQVPALTLIDSLDTIVLLGNISEFFHAVQALEIALPQGFDVDANVSVFETTIRLLGGLLSAHLLAEEYLEDKYNNQLLDLAIDLGQRLLPAFNTSTGIPFGTVNLRYGVPKRETPIASLAGGGSLSLEFAILSALSGRTEFAAKASEAVRALYQRRHLVSGLLGKHINTQNGKWIEPISGIGSNSDSFYEYLLKMYALFGEIEYWSMFDIVYESAMSAGIMRGDWYNDVDMFTGKQRKQHFENLQAFWSGLEISAGFLGYAQRSLNAFHLIFNDLGSLPEDFDFVNMRMYVHNGPSHRAPLRPELAESTYLMYRATREPSWLWAGANMLEAIEELNAVDCGYAATLNALTQELDDEMPSFFLSETAKYLYLLFDDENPLHTKDIVFSTEAHPFDATKIRSLARKHNLSRTIATTPMNQNTVLVHPNTLNLAEKETKQKQEAWWHHMWRIFKRKSDKRDDTDILQPIVSTVPNTTLLKPNALPPRVCYVLEWWQSIAYDPDFVDSLEDLRRPARCPISATPPKLPAQIPVTSPLKPPQKSQNKIKGPNGVEYEIQVFADGIHVASDDETIEISRVDESITLASSVLADDDVQMIAVATDGQQILCELKLFAEDELVANFECTAAAFGPSGALTNSELRTEAKLLAPRLIVNREMCFAMVAESALESILVAQRGTCLFQEKAKWATDAGASALVVINSEPGPARFVMASSSSSTNSEKSDYDLIPTVMISNLDGLVLQRLLMERSVLDSTLTPLMAKLIIRKREIQPDAPLKLHSANGMLKVMGRSGWGVVITSESDTSSSNEWKLFIVNEEDENRKEQQIQIQKSIIDSLAQGKNLQGEEIILEETSEDNSVMTFYHKETKERYLVYRNLRCDAILWPTSTFHVDTVDSTLSLLTPDEPDTALASAYYAARCKCYYNRSVTT